MKRVVCVLAMGFAVGCSEKPKKKEVVVDSPPTTHRVVVTPSSFECEKFLPTSEVSRVLGATMVPTQGHFAPPNGVPQPCHYQPKSVGTASGDEDDSDADDDAAEPPPAPEAWSFDLDCRRTAERDGEKLMAQYTKAGAKPLGIGRGGVDHRDTVLLFIDDDAPCYARVAGPEAKGRAKLANLIASTLNRENAPMTAAAARVLSQRQNAEDE